LWQLALNELQKLLFENTGAPQEKVCCLECYLICTANEAVAYLTKFQSVPSQDQLAKAYLRYLQVLKQLDEVYTYIRQPQHREAVATTLLCCAGLLTETWSALVAANKGIDVIDFGSYLLELQLTPDDLEVPVSTVLKASDRFGQTTLKAALGKAAGGRNVPAASNYSAPAEPFSATVKFSTKALPAGYSKAPISKAVHLDAASIGKNSSSPNEAAAKIQRAWRGWRDRRSAADKKLQEFEYLGMSEIDNMSIHITSTIDLEEGAVARRERRRREYEQAKLEIEELLQVQESPLMVLEERNQVNTWLEDKLKNQRECWPEVPLDGELSPAVQDNNILSSENQNSKIKSTKGKTIPSAKEAALSSASGKARKAGSGNNSASTNTTTLPKSALTTFASQLELLIKDWKLNGEKSITNEDNQQDAWVIGTDTTNADAATNTTFIIDEPLPALEGLPVPRRGSSIDAIDLRLLTTTTRPRIKEKVRLTVREQARQVAAAANAARPAPPIAKQKQSAPGSKSPSKVAIPAAKAIFDKPAASSMKSSKPGRTVKEPKEPKPEPLPPSRDLEEIFKDLAEQHIPLQSPETKFDKFIGTVSLVIGAATGDMQPVPVKKAKSGGKAANIAAKTSEPLLPYPEFSFAQIRQLLAVKCVLPLAIHGYNTDQKLTTRTKSGSCPVTALIYGPPGSGKTMLVHAITHESNATLFDLSPKNLAGKFPGQQSIDIAIQSVFTAAKAAAPAIIYIDNIEQVFIRDEKRAAQLAEEMGGEPASRIRRQLLVETAALKAEDGVLVLCTSREPQACVSADEAAFVSFFQFLVSVPLPDDRCRRAILQHLALEFDCSGLWTAEQLGLAAQLTQGYTAGQLKIIMTNSLDLFNASKEKTVDILDCFIISIAAEVKADAAEVQTVAEWTARAHAILNKTAAELAPVK
jgi:IQ and AAA domain-containing protein